MPGTPCGKNKADSRVGKILWNKPLSNEERRSS